MNTKVVITGGTGLLGATLMQVLRDEVVALKSDVTDAKTLAKEIARIHDVSWIIHTAAITDVAACEYDREKAFAVNAEGTRNIIAAAGEMGARLLYISTASVFSGETGNYRETDLSQPKNVYSRSKVKGEEYVAAHKNGLILRLNLIGIHPNGSRGENFMEWLVDSVKENKDISLFEDVFINPLSNWTTAEMNEKIIKIDPSEKVLHISSIDVKSKADIGEMVIKRFPFYSGTLKRTSIDTINEGVVRPKQIWLNVDYTKEKLKFTFPTVESEIDTIFYHV